VGWVGLVWVWVGIVLFSRGGPFVSLFATCSSIIFLLQEIPRAAGSSCDWFFLFARTN